MNIMNIQKIKPASNKNLPVTKLINISFAEKIIEKYRTVRLGKQFGTLVFRKSQKEFAKSDAFTGVYLPKTVHNNRLLIKEYKPVINLYTGKKEQIILRTSKEKLVPILGYKDRVRLIPMIIGGKQGEYGKTAEHQYSENLSTYHSGSLRSNSYHSSTKYDIGYPPTGLKYTRPEASEKMYISNLTEPDNNLLQQNPTSQEFISHHHNRINSDNLSKIHETNLPAYQHIIRRKPNTYIKQSPVADSPKRHSNNSENLNEQGLINGQQKLLIKNNRPNGQNLLNDNFEDIIQLSNNYSNIYKKNITQHLKHYSNINKEYITQISKHYSNINKEDINRLSKYYTNTNNEDITQLSKYYLNIYNVDRKNMVQAEKIYHRVAENNSRQLNGTRIQTEFSQKELNFVTAPKLIDLLEKKERAYIENSVPMTIHRKITGDIPKSKDSGLILYKPKQVKPPEAEEKKPPDILVRPSEVYTQAVASSKPAKVSLADNPEEVSLIAEKVFGIIEKRLEIQKDRRGLR